ncbi:MAG: hypothetical protein LLG04_08540 [Parachlamydia sp.]|nr:hypothetical protein [Parachlamydia sp.]
MICEVCAVIAVIIFAVLAFALILTLTALFRLVTALENKMRKCDPLFRSLETMGEVCERETVVIKNDPNLSHDLVDWMLVSLKLSKQLLQRR